MPPFMDLFGRVIPARLGAPVQALLSTQDGNGTRIVPAVITLRIDETNGLLVIDYLCLTSGDEDPTEAADIFNVAFNENQPIAIKFDTNQPASDLVAQVLTHNFLSTALGDQARGSLMVISRELQTGPDLLHAARLCIPDFPLFTGQGASTTVETTYSHAPGLRSWRPMGYVELEADDWRITLAQRTEPSPTEYSHDALVPFPGRFVNAGKLPLTLDS